MVNDFEEKYQEILENLKEISQYRMKLKNKWILIIISVLIIIGILFAFHHFGLGIVVELFIIWLPLFLILFTFIILKYIGNSYSVYRKLFKERIIRESIRVVDERLIYKPEVGITRSVYDRAIFDEEYDIFISEDLIIGKVKADTDIKMADVHTKITHTDINEGTKIRSVFEGKFVESKLSRNIDAYIKIYIDGRKGFDVNKIELDSTEFEREFDVYSNNKILAMQLLTSDIMDMLVQLVQRNNIEFEISIINDMLYMRFHIEDMFEPNIWSEEKNKMRIKRDFYVLKFITDFVVKFEKVIQDLPE